MAAAVAVPLLPLLQDTSMEAEMDTAGPETLGTFTVVMEVQPFASVTVTS